MSGQPAGQYLDRAAPVLGLEIDSPHLRTGQCSGESRTIWTYRLGLSRVPLRRQKMNTLLKYKFWIGGALGLIVAALVLGAMRPKHVSGAQPEGSPVVELVQVEQKDVPIYGEWIGTLDEYVNADVRGAGDGLSAGQAGLPGGRVRQSKAYQLLFEIDLWPFRARRWTRPRAKWAAATAFLLANAEASSRLRLSLDVNRYRLPAQEEAVSQQDLDNAIQNSLTRGQSHGGEQASRRKSGPLRLLLKPLRSIWNLRGSSPPSMALPGKPSFK